MHAHDTSKENTRHSTSRPFFSDFASTTPFFAAPPELQTKTDDTELADAGELTPIPQPETERPASTEGATPPPDDGSAEPPTDNATSTVQTKLMVGSTDDPYEREADAVSDRVIHGGDAPGITLVHHSATTLHRQPEDEEEEAVEPLQTKDGAEGEAPATVQQGLEQSRGSGSALPLSTQDTMEESFGVDFSDVRVHTDTNAQAMNYELSARAFTYGSDIYFNTGEYHPETPDGKHLLAHELAHVRQQTATSGQLVIARNVSPGANTDELIALGIDPRPFGAIWEEFAQLRRSAHDTEAVALVATLIARMEMNNAIDHAGDLALWLIARGERDLARRALDELESAWWIRYISAGGEGVPPWINAGLGLSAGPEDLVAVGETEAGAGSHETARKLLGIAYLMIQMMLAQLYERRARDEAAAEAMGEAGPMFRAMARALPQSDIDRLTVLRTRVLNVYPHLASAARAGGDAVRAGALASEGQVLSHDIGARYTLADLPDATNLDTPIGPAERSAPRRGGAPVRPPATTAAAAPPVPAARPEPPPAPDRVVEESPPFEGATALALPGNHYVSVRSERYAVSEVLSRATAWARNLFGVKSGIVVMHADGDGVIRYYAAALDEDLTESFPAANPLQAISVAVSVRLERLPDNYEIMVIHVGNGVGFWPSPEREAAYSRIVSREAVRGAEVTTLGRELVRTTVFAQIDELMRNEDQNLEEIARRLAQLDSTAFSTLSTERRFQYLSILLRAWTFQAQERAVVELMKSVESRTELDAIITRLQGADLWEALIDDLDNELWSLLITVGERFGTEQVTVRGVYDIMAEAGLLQVGTPIPGLSVGPNGPEFSADVFAEIEEAANSFLRFVEGIWDAIVMLVTRPDRIVEGLAQLTKMIFVFKLAELGYLPAVMMRQQILEQFGRQLLNGFKGIGVLGVGREVVRRIKWAIIWEIASFFIGVGEIRAAMTTMGASARVGAIARFLRLLGIAGRAAEVEETTSALTRLAGILGRSGRVLRTEEEVLVGLSHLPEGEATRLARALEGIELDARMTLVQLRSAHPELAGIAEESLRRAEIVHRLAAKVGGFSDEVARAFARLSGAGHGTEDLARIVSHIPDGEGARFLRTMRMIPEDVSLSGSRALNGLETIAQSASRMQAVERFGYRAVDAALERAGRNGALADEYLAALGSIEEGLPAASRATEMRRLVEGLERGDADALLRIETQIRQESHVGAASLRAHLRQETNAWASQFPTGAPRGGNPNATAFQTRYCGPTETHVQGGGAEVWADGIIPDEAMLRDAKLTETPARSPYVDANPHPIPDFVLQQMRDRVERELRSYARVINDPATPVVGLEIVTNTPASVPFWDRMLSTYGIPGRVVVRPWP